MINIRRGLALSAAVLCTLASAQVLNKDEVELLPDFNTTLPEGYRNWKLISVAHEGGMNNDIRAILGNDIAVKAAAAGQLPFPEGSVLVRLAYRYTSSAQNNAVFGQEQSWVAGEPTNVQIEIKDSKRFSQTGGWGYAQFDNGLPHRASKDIASCYACHAKLPASKDFVFTEYSK